jgi:hypothetical protein
MALDHALACTPRVLNDVAQIPWMERRLQCLLRSPTELSRVKEAARWGSIYLWGFLGLSAIAIQDT